MPFDPRKRDRKKPRFGNPVNSYGNNGDVEIFVTPKGVGLFGKFNDEWVLFGEAKNVAELGKSNILRLINWYGIKYTLPSSGDGGSANVLTSTNNTLTWETIDHDLLYNFDSDEHYTQANIVATGALNSGSITSGFGNIDIGSSTIDTTGNVSVGDLQVNGNDIAFDAASSTIGIDASAHDAAGQGLTITSGSTTAGTSNDQAGGILHLRGGQGKGSGAGGGIRFSVANEGSSGSSLNSYATALTIEDDKKADFGGNVVLNGGDLFVKGPSGDNAELFLIADDEEDNADIWKILATDSAASNILTFTNKISGSHVSHFTITPHATVASSGASFAGDLSVNGTNGILAGAVIWHEWIFNVFRGVADRYYFRDVDDSDNFRSWDAYDTLTGSNISIPTVDVAGHFNIPESCTIKEMHGQVINDGSTSCPTVTIWHGDPSDATDVTLTNLGSAQPNSGSSLVSQKSYIFSKTNFSTDLSAGDIIVPTVHYGVGSLQAFIGSLTVKFITR